MLCVRCRWKPGVIRHCCGSFLLCSICHDTNIRLGHCLVQLPQPPDLDEAYWRHMNTHRD
jgi:hypothetical protein